MLRFAIVLLATALSAACAPRVVRTNAPPSEVQLRLATLPRVWVAGFAAERNAGFDVNGETVRLVREQLRSWSAAEVVDAEPLTIDTRQRFSDVEYWRRLGEEHRNPLIVTGIVTLHIAPAKVEHRGFRTVYVHATGRVLEATVILIDGRNGRVFSTTMLPSRMRYGVGGFAAAPVLFVQMMRTAASDWLGAITRTRAGA